MNAPTNKLNVIQEDGVHLVIPKSWTLTRLADDHIVVEREFPDTQLHRNRKESYAFSLDKNGKLNTTCYKKAVFNQEQTSWISGRCRTATRTWAIKTVRGRRGTYAALIYIS